jgi:hypothetical protein
MSSRRAGRLLVGGTLFAILGMAPPYARAQPPRTAGDHDGDRAFVEALQREDPSSAERYLALRDARMKGLAELQRAQDQYGAGGPELRSLSLPLLRQAQRRYAESSLALLDFLDERNRRAIANYQDEINRINRVLEEHEGMRAELGKLLEH